MINRLVGSGRMHTVDIIHHKNLAVGAGGGSNCFFFLLKCHSIHSFIVRISIIRFVFEVLLPEPIQRASYPINIFYKKYLQIISHVRIGLSKNWHLQNSHK
jgi:hypothetical protein